MFFFYDPTFILLIPAIILAVYAQYKVKSTYNKYSKITAQKNISGASLGARLLADAGIKGVAVEHIEGELTDHYDPKAKKLRLSSGVYSGSSVAALGIVAHEVGHAMQDSKAYAPLRVRNNLVPAANFGTTLAFPLFFFGIIFSWGPLMDIGILLFAVAVAFQIVTLPVELNASRRAMALLEKGNYLVADELGMAKKVLSAAALTYIAATAMAVLNLVRLLILRNSRD